MIYREETILYFESSAPVNPNGLTRDEPGPLPSQEGNHGRHLLHRPNPAQRMAPGLLLKQLLQYLSIESALSEEHKVENKPTDFLCLPFGICPSWYSPGSRHSLLCPYRPGPQRNTFIIIL